MKKLAIVIILLLLAKPVYCQNYELYTGSVISEDSDMHPGYMIGVNTIINLNQNRHYLNKLIVGFEHSAFMSPNMKYGSESKQSDIQQSCNCTYDNIGFEKSQYSLKKEVRAVSLTFGLEVFKGKRFYLLTGVTNYQHIFKVNNEKIEEYRTMQIDAGMKYLIKINNWYLSPTFKFNPETMSFGIGFVK